MYLNISDLPFKSSTNYPLHLYVQHKDPEDATKTVLVIRSLVPGGVADRDGRLLPGDRLMFVNETELEGSSLDYAVHVLKSTGYGPVRIGVAKPLPVCTKIYI